MTHTITFVSPRYGADVIGGAEQGARAYATRMAADGWSVRVLASCARSSVTWEDDYSPGTTVEEGVEVTRCRVRDVRDPDLDALSSRMFGSASTTLAEAYDWIDRQGPDSPELLEAIASVDDGVLSFIPYLYQPTVRGIHRAQVPACLQAATHPEPPLSLPVFDELFGAADALLHGSRAEQQLVLDRFPQTSSTPQAVLGYPVEIDGPTSGEDARTALGLGDEPFCVYLGRVDAGKGVVDLVERFAAFRERRGSGRLVIAGPVIDRPPTVPGVELLGLVPSEYKYGLLAAADVLINPSPHESFSFVVPEAFLVGTPALVNGRCLPMREHCENSHGGLWYTGVADFEAALGRLLDDPGLRHKLAEAGRDYTESMFSWDAVKARWESVLSRVS